MRAFKRCMRWNSYLLGFFFLLQSSHFQCLKDHSDHGLIKSLQKRCTYVHTVFSLLSLILVYKELSVLEYKKKIIPKGWIKDLKFFPNHNSWQQGFFFFFKANSLCLCTYLHVSHWKTWVSLSSLKVHVFILMGGNVFQTDVEFLSNILSQISGRPKGIYYTSVWTTGSLL